MYESLEEVSKRLDDVVAQLIVDTKKDLDNVTEAIENLNIKLQNMEKTDLSENADYQIAKDDLSIKNARRNILMKKLESMSRDIGSYIPTGFIALGSTVELNVETVDGNSNHKVPKTKFIFKLVQHDTSNALSGLVSIDSKVGSAILGHRANEHVEVEAPGGLIKYKIERIY